MKSEERHIEPPADLPGWVDYCLVYLGQVAKEKRRKHDFPPRLLLCDAAGRLAIVYGLESLLQDEEGKNALGQVVMPDLIRMMEATRFCWATGAWRSPRLGDPNFEAFVAWHDDNVAAGELGLEGGPGVTEVVQAVFGEWTGDQCLRAAAIVREKDRKGDLWRLGEWENPMEIVGADVMNWMRDTTAFRGRMVDDSMRVLIGQATEGEVRDAIRQVAADPEVQELLIRAISEEAEARGLSDEDVLRITSSDPASEESTELMHAAAARVAADDPVSKKLMTDFLRRVGPPSPLA